MKDIDFQMAKLQSKSAFTSKLETDTGSRDTGKKLYYFVKHTVQVIAVFFFIFQCLNAEAVFYYLDVEHSVDNDQIGPLASLIVYLIYDGE